MKKRDNPPDEINARNSGPASFETGKIKAAASRLKYAEDQIRLLIRNIPDLVWFKDPEGIYKFCNQKFERFFGAKEEDIIGKTDYDFVPRDLADHFRKHDKMAVESRKPCTNEETVTFAADGHCEILETIKTPVFRRDGRLLGVLGIGRDITERKRMEEINRYQELLLEEMGRIAKIGGWEFDPATGQGTWTAETARIHDLDPNEPTNAGRGLSFFHGDNRRKIEKAIKDAVDFGRPWDLELELVSAKGKRKWVNTQGRPTMTGGKAINIRGAIQDITERKATEKCIGDHALRLRLALQAARMGAWDWDVRNDKVQWSEETMRIFGIEKDAFGGNYMAYLDFAHPDVRDHVNATVESFLKNAHDSDTIQYEHKIIRGDGATGWIEVRGTLTLDEHGRPDYMTGVVADITERVAARRKLERYRDHLETMVSERTAQLEAANKELESFSYSVSHDLRAPLRAINGFTRMLMEEYGPQLGGDGLRVCTVICDSAKDMGNLIDDLLAFSRVGRCAIIPSPVDMGGLAKAIFFELTTPQDRQRIDLHISRMPQAEMDPTMARQVWSNLLSNAIKFSSKKERAKIDIHGQRDHDEAVYWVSDNGAGFDMQYVDKIFSVFQRLHSSKEFEGTGVGLAIVQRIVHLHGGRISARAQVGKGATFRFALPARQAAGRTRRQKEENK